MRPLKILLHYAKIHIHEATKGILHFPDEGYLFTNPRGILHFPDEGYLFTNPQGIFHFPDGGYPLGAKGGVDVALDSFEHMTEIAALHPAYIIMDEFHRAGAEHWGERVQKLLALYPDANF